MKLIIFDIDGTLCDSNNIDDACFVQAFKDVCEINISETNWDNYKHVTDSGITNKLFNEKYKRNPVDDEIKDIKERYLYLLQKSFDENPNMIIEINGAVKTVKKLNDSNKWEVGIATGSWKEIALLKLKYLNLDKLDLLLGHSNKFVSKNEIIGSLINMAEKKNAVKSFEKIIYAGDREYDFK